MYAGMLNMHMKKKLFIGGLWWLTTMLWLGRFGFWSDSVKVSWLG